MVVKVTGRDLDAVWSVKWRDWVGVTIFILADRTLSFWSLAALLQHASLPHHHQSFWLLSYPIVAHCALSCPIPFSPTNKACKYNIVI